MAACIHTCLLINSVATTLKLFWCFVVGVETGNRKSSTVSPNPRDQVNGILLENEDSVLVGLAVSWENYDAYYISLTALNSAGWVALALTSNNRPDVTFSVGLECTDLWITQACCRSLVSWYIQELCKLELMQVTLQQ